MVVLSPSRTEQVRETIARIARAAYGDARVEGSVRARGPGSVTGGNPIPVLPIRKRGFEGMVCVCVCVLVEGTLCARCFQRKAKGNQLFDPIGLLVHHVTREV